MAIIHHRRTRPTHHRNCTGNVNAEKQHTKNATCKLNLRIGVSIVLGVSLMSWWIWSWNNNVGYVEMILSTTIVNSTAVHKETKEQDVEVEVVDPACTL